MNVAYGSFWAPMTKTAPRGEEILWTDSECSCSASWAILNHRSMNSNVPLATPLFAFEMDTGRFAPMRHTWFLDCCNEIWTDEHLEPLNGHAFRIGGTTHLLLLGVDPLIVMVQGHWRSSTFLEYWQHCEEILPTMIGISLHSQSLIISTMSAFKQSLLGSHL